MMVNEGEFANLEMFLMKITINIGLYKNVIVPAGPTTWANIQEMPTGGGRGYAPMQLARVLSYLTPATATWFLSLSAVGKAQAAYDIAPLQWIMAAQEVSDANTIEGSFKFYWMIPFQNGANLPPEGTQIKGATSGATAYITGVVTLSGVWGSGTAAGHFYLETKTGTFQNGENLTNVAGSTTYAQSASATKNAGDAWKQIIDVCPMLTPQLVNQLGLPISVSPVISLDNDASITG